VVAIVGRLVPQKAHDRFLAAAAEVATQRPDVVFLVVGEGPLRAGLERRTGELGLTRAVRFTGLRSDARDLIARADVLVFSSLWEGLSIAALEALAAGTPVVTTAAEGMGPLADEGAAITVPGGQDGALGSAIVALLADEALRQEMGAVGRRLAAGRFSLPAMVDAYEALYAEIVLR
jgi:glycosyltransferase involved in cell wall biosynthesis